MIRAISRLLAGLITAVGVMLMVVATLGVRPSWAQTVPSCQLTGDIVIDLYDGTAVRSDLDEQGATNGPFSISIPAGTYELAFMSFDRHSSEDGTLPQTEEQWFLRGLSGGSIVFESGSISDLAEDVDVLTEVVHNAVDIPELDAVTAYHSAFGSATARGPNSVHPICAAFTLVQQPTTTTQATTTTTQPVTTTTQPVTTTTQPVTTTTQPVTTTTQPVTTTTQPVTTTTQPVTTTTQPVTTTTQPVTTTTQGTTDSTLSTTTTTQGGTGGTAATTSTTVAVQTGGGSSDDGDSDTGVLGVQLEQLPFTGVTDPQLAMLGAALMAIGTLVLAAVREESSPVTDEVIHL